MRATSQRVLTRRQVLTLAATALCGCESPPKAALAAPTPAGPAPAEPTPAEPAPVAGEPTPRRIIALQPLGPQIPDAQVKLVQTALSAFYDYEIQMLPRAVLPKHAYYSPRQRYRAEKLLLALEPQKPPAAERILALTSVDISTTKGKIHDWGILGLASIDGSVCIISSFRTKRGAQSARHAAERFAKTAVHEIGHTMGLPHCPNRGCLMQDGKGSVFTTDGEYDLCSSCRGKLTARDIPLLASDGTSIPWPKPG